MRSRITAVMVIGIVCAAATAEAKDRSIEQLPADLWTVATLWTEPIKEAAKQTRQFDPISGLWLGLIDGSVRSVARTAKFFIPQEDKNVPGPDYREGKAILRYSF